MRTLSSGRPRLAATWPRSACSHWVATNRSTPPSSAGTARPGLRAEERLILHADLVLAAHDHVRARPGVVQVSAADLDPADEVAARMQRRRVRGEGRARVGQGRQNLIVGLDPGDRAAGRFRVIGRHQRYRLALVPDLVDGQHRLIGVLEPVGLMPGHVVVGQDGGHPWQRQRCGDVEAGEPGPGVRAPQGGTPEHAVQPQVGGVGELPGDLRPAVGTGGTVADLPGGSRRSGPGRGRGTRRLGHRSAARRSRAARTSRAAAVTSVVRSSLCSTTGVPPTRRSSRGAGGPRTSAATGSPPACSPSGPLRDRVVRERVDPPQGDVGEQARPQGADLVRPAQAAGAAAGSEP